MKWQKLGRIFEPKGQYDWCVSHAMLPIAELIDEDVYKIYFSGRDSQNRSLIGCVNININDPLNILYISPEPVLGLGKLGCFDDNGVTPTWLLHHKGKRYLYYLGWNKGSSVRAAEVTGLAIGNEFGKFDRYSQAPILSRTNKEPYLISVISCVLSEGNLLRMWYDSCDEWISPELPRYNIKYAESIDGVNWVRQKIVSVDYKSKEESRVSRACVYKDGSIYKMYYCYALNGEGYRIGYGESNNGVEFKRMDDIAGIDVSESGWDSEMICYPFIFAHKGKRYMLYCGNGYGKTGFGLAVME